MAARAAADHRPDPLDRPPARGPRRAGRGGRRSRDRADHAVRDRRAYGAAVVSFVIATAGGIVGGDRVRAPTTPATCSGSVSPRRCSASGSGSSAGPSTSTSTSTRCRSASRSSTTPAARRSCTTELRTTGAVLGRRRMLARAARRVVRQPGRRVRRADRFARSEAAWRAGPHVVACRLAAGVARRHADRAVVGTTYDQLVTVFPEGHIGVDDSQVVLLRMPPELLTQRTIDGGALEGWVAYSKICTHAGCSVGLFGVDNRRPDTLRQLVCPCHQSVFDPVDGARPIGGPATRVAAAAAARRRRRRLPRGQGPVRPRRRPRRVERSMTARTAIWAGRVPFPALGGQRDDSCHAAHPDRDLAGRP